MAEPLHFPWAVTTEGNTLCLHHCTGQLLYYSSMVFSLTNMPAVGITVSEVQTMPPVLMLCLLPAVTTWLMQLQAPSENLATLPSKSQSLLNCSWLCLSHIPIPELLTGPGEHSVVIGQT